MLVSVVVPTFRRPDLLQRCLAALHRQQFPQCEFEVVVADDAADEATRQLIESRQSPFFSACYIPVNGHHGPAAARNAGWRAARGQFIAFTDDDCIPDSGWLSAGLQPFADPTVVAVTGQTIVPLPRFPTDHDLNTAGLERSEFLTANCFCRRAVLADLGGFDEQFTSAWREDSDLHFRLLDTGGKVVRQCAAVVVHPVRQAAWGNCIHEQRKSLFDALLFRKHPRRFRQRIRPRCPWNYYLVVMAAFTTIFAAALGASVASAVAGTIWLLVTIQFCFRRLKNTTWSFPHLVEMLVTSPVIPFLSVYWRICGAIRFRVLFW